MFHLFHEPMTMGCSCTERLCQRCSKIGDVTKCPTCRKYKKKPRVDRKLLKSSWKAGDLIKCLGCSREVYSRYLHRHETRCPKYRDAIQALFEEDLRVRRVQCERNENAMADMEARLDIQADTIDELEDQVEELERLSQRQEQERQLYVLENGRLLRSLESFMAPIYTNMRSMEAVYSRMSQTATSLRASRAHHQVLRRQHHIITPTTSQTQPQPQPQGAAAALNLHPGHALQVQSPSPFQTPRLMIPPSRMRNAELEEGEVVEEELEVDDDEGLSGDDVV